MNPIQNFYRTQDKLVAEMNKQYEQYLDKKVRILLTGEKNPCKLEYAQVFYQGIYNEHGTLYLKYKSVKKDGTPAKNLSNIILFYFDQLEFNLIDE